MKVKELGVELSTISIVVASFSTSDTHDTVACPKKRTAGQFFGQALFFDVQNSCMNPSLNNTVTAVDSATLVTSDRKKLAED